MKTFKSSLQAILLILVIFCFSSCEKKVTDNIGKGRAEFSINLPSESSQLKSVTLTDSGKVSFQLLISVETLTGKQVMTDTLIPIYAFGPGFVSENIELDNGEFKLTKFMVIDPSGKVVFASPIAGSPLAYLINRTLPFNFNIYPGQVTKVLPEVLSVGDQSPDKFGYVSFGVQIIKPLDFYAICILDNPMLMAPTQMTQAKVTIYAKDGWHYAFNLEARLNHLIIRGGSDIYSFLIEKEGYPAQKLQFPAQVLIASKQENPLVLKIPWNSNEIKILSLQPGPEAGKDAMISNLEPDKNFGPFRYFEASYMPAENAPAVMCSRRSLIWFDMSLLPKSAVIKKVVLKLSYDVPIPWDSTIFVASNSGTIISNLGGVLQQVIEPWEEDKVIWNNQPKTTELNQVFIPPFIRNTNFIEVDVTRLIVSPVINPLPNAGIYPLPNFGMLFKLVQNDKFKGFRFASSDYPEASLRPKLTIQYTLPN